MSRGKPKGHGEVVTVAIRKAILECVANGMSRRRAAALNNTSYNSINNWITRNPEFAAELEAAEEVWAEKQSIIAEEETARLQKYLSDLLELKIKVTTVKKTFIHATRDRDGNITPVEKILEKEEFTTKVELPPFWLIERLLPPLAPTADSKIEIVVDDSTGQQDDEDFEE
ncbi:MAG TPA: helix-turn-helix domain-containing protein [Coleofasciculaceae cyanobacterium]|jgi:transposase